MCKVSRSRVYRCVFIGLKRRYQKMVRPTNFAKQLKAVVQSLLPDLLCSFNLATANSSIIVPPSKSCAVNGRGLCYPPAHSGLYIYPYLVVFTPYYPLPQGILHLLYIYLTSILYPQSEIG